MILLLLIVLKFEFVFAFVFAELKLVLVVNKYLLLNNSSSLFVCFIEYLTLFSSENVYLFCLPINMNAGFKIQKSYENKELRQETNRFLP